MIQFTALTIDKWNKKKIPCEFQLFWFQINLILFVLISYFIFLFLFVFIVHFTVTIFLKGKQINFKSKRFTIVFIPENKIFQFLLSEQIVTRQFTQYSTQHVYFNLKFVISKTFCFCRFFCFFSLFLSSSVTKIK